MFGALDMFSEHGSVVLAVDVGLKAGFAWFDADGMLIRARSTRFPNRTVLKRALSGVFSEIDGVECVVLEGQGDIADIFRKGAARAGLSVQQFSAEQWRKDMLWERERRSGKQAKTRAETLALEVARASGKPAKCGYDDDAAEAVMFGLWYVSVFSRGRKEK